MLQLRHCHFFSVCDGHGHNGQDVSGLLKHRLPFNIETGLKAALQGETGYPKKEIMEQVFLKAFEQSNKQVCSMVSDVRFSGSTCISVLTYGRKLYVPNVGDSRAIMVRQNPNNPSTCTAIELSRDHKPDDPDEYKVIMAHNGRVDSYRDQLGN
jgi:serine/threonine protein phosphatase PrpC